MTYDTMAVEYYESRHRTSRNFDQASAQILNDLLQTIDVDDHRTLEVGAGRGRNREFLHVEANSIQLDVSLKMLQLKDREPALGRICGDAVALPLAGGTFTLMTAFLFDPFNTPGFFAEIARVLQRDGVFIGTIPGYDWGVVLRDAVQIPRDYTEFVLNTGEKCKVFSHLSTDAELRSQCSAVGLEVFYLEHASLPPDTKVVSDHVRIPSRVREIPISELPIVTVVAARRA